MITCEEDGNSNPSGEETFITNILPRSQFGPLKKVGSASPSRLSFD